MISITTGLEILGVIAGGIFLAGRIEATTKANQEAITQLAELIKQHMKDTKDMIQLSKDYQRETLSREISHIKDLISISNNEMREDIKRLEKAQRESNRVKERLAIAESSLKSLHHRLDIEPPILLEGPKDN